MKIRDVTTRRLRHSVAAAGSGRPLLLLHGFTGAKEDFADWVDPLGDRGWEVVAPDLRGHGSSDAPSAESDYSLDLMADDAVALADALGWDEFALLGHSMGGMIAQEVARRVGDRLDALVLMDTSHTAVEGIDPELLATAVAIVRTEGIDRLVEITVGRESPLTTRADARVRAERPGYVEFAERKMRSCSPAMYVAMAQELVAGADRLDGLRELQVPTLVVVGDQDTPFIAPSHRMAEAIPGATLEVIPDAGHSPQFENPDRWWKVVSRFLETGGDGAGPSEPARADPTDA